MNVSMLKIEAFVACADCGSLTKAAQRLGTSQPSVSRMISELEDAVALQLIERSHAGLRLTPEGERLLPHARSAVNAKRRFMEEAHLIRGAVSGTLRIAAFSSAATHLLPAMLQKFRDDCPQVNFELLMGDYSEAEEWILSGRADCGFLIQPCSNKLGTRVVMHDRHMAVLPQSHPLAGQDVFPISALQGEPFLLLEKGSLTAVTDLLEKNGVRPDVRFSTIDDYAIMSMVEKGLGLAILPELILRRCPYRIAALPLDVPAQREIVFAVPRRLKPSPLVTRFLQYVETASPS